MGNRYRLIGFVILAVGVLVASVGPSSGLTLDNFEGYFSDSELHASWVASSNGLESLETDPANVFEGDHAMRVDYDCSLGDFTTVYTYDVGQDWTSFTTFSLMFLGAMESSGEGLVVELRDQWGNFVKGSVVANATQALSWTEYSVDVSGWANREWLKEIRVSLEADAGGSGTVYLDYMFLPSAISVNANTWSRIKNIYGNKKQEG